MNDIILGAVLLLIVGGALAYIIRAKRKGVKCIGCPAAKSCAAERDSACGGNCSSCKYCG